MYENRPVNVTISKYFVQKANFEFQPNMRERERERERAQKNTKVAIRLWRTDYI